MCMNVLIRNKTWRNRAINLSLNAMCCLASAYHEEDEATDAETNSSSMNSSPNACHHVSDAQMMRLDPFNDTASFYLVMS